MISLEVEPGDTDLLWHLDCQIPSDSSVSARDPKMTEVAGARYMSDSFSDRQQIATHMHHRQLYRSHRFLIRSNIDPIGPLSSSRGPAATLTTRNLKATQAGKLFIPVATAPHIPKTPREASVDTASSSASKPDIYEEPLVFEGSDVIFDVTKRGPEVAFHMACRTQQCRLLTDGFATSDSRSEDESELPISAKDPKPRICERTGLLNVTIPNRGLIRNPKSPRSRVR